MHNTPKHTIALAACLLAGAAHAQAQAPVSPGSLVGIGTMSATCSTVHGSGNGLAISDLLGSGFFADGTQCTGQALAGSGASSSSAFTSGLATTTATGQATLGTLRPGSTLDVPIGSSTLFPVSISQTAFADTVTVNWAGHQGQNGFLLVHVHVSGALDASGAAGSAGLNVAAMKDKVTLSASNPGYDRSTGNATSTDRQTAAWAVASYPVPGPVHDHLDVNDTITFSLPVTFGTPFEMQLVGLAIAGTRSQDGSGHSFSDFAHTITWGGVAGVLQNGSAVNGYTLTSLSGVDWSQAAPVPEPAPWLMLAAGIAALRVRRSSR